MWSRTQLPPHLLHAGIISLDADALQDLLDVTAGGVLFTPESGQKVSSYVTHPLINTHVQKVIVQSVCEVPLYTPESGILDKHACVLYIRAARSITQKYKPLSQKHCNYRLYTHSREFNSSLYFYCISSTRI